VNTQEPQVKKRKLSRFSKNEKKDEILPKVESQGAGSDKKISSDSNDNTSGDNVIVASSRVLTTPQVTVR
jgi:hypothetical protein